MLTVKHLPVQGHWQIAGAVILTSMRILLEQSGAGVVQHCGLLRLVIDTPSILPPETLHNTHTKIRLNYTLDEIFLAPVCRLRVRVHRIGVRCREVRQVVRKDRREDVRQEGMLRVGVELLQGNRQGEEE